MNEPKANAKMVTKLLFRLLPIQILLAAVNSVNGIVSSFFAANYVGVNAMSAVGLYGPINTFLGAISTMLAGGSAILCGKYLGRNEQEKVQRLFSLNLLFSALFAGFCCIVFLILGLFDLTGFFTRDPADFMKNAGIRLIYRIARDVDYQNLLGLNVLTIRI